MKNKNYCMHKTISDDCEILTVVKCIGENCSFAQTKAQAKRSLEKKYALLRSLSKEKQAHFAKKYYEGKKPWQKRGVSDDR